ncbi:MAG: hypothetical protein K0R92_348 [Lachnospiraceae bacterium]|jgi:hypothetical protein|nr:hypothetical protein [Lachnospiraceae bacterium]
MINEITQAIVDKLAMLYPGYTLYTDDVPQKFKTPSFLVSLISHDYAKSILGNNGTANFDVAYFSDKKDQDIKSDCRTKDINLMRNIDLIGDFRAIRKSTQIVDNVLHLTFTVKYSEIEIQEGIKMQQQQTNTSL